MPNTRMSGAVEKVVVPDIGDFGEVPIIEILVSPGDTVAVEDPLITLESDKATMDVPAPFAGVVAALKVKIGDRVAQGIDADDHRALQWLRPGRRRRRRPAPGGRTRESTRRRRLAPDTGRRPRRPPGPTSRLPRRATATAAARSTPARPSGGWPASSESSSTG